MQPKLSLLTICALVIGFSLLGTSFCRRPDPSSPSPGPIGPPVISIPPAQTIAPPPTSPTLGDQILLPYASPQTTLEEDLTLFKNYLSNVLLLVKQHDSRHYATNEDLAEFLLGERGQQETFLSPQTPVLNSQNQLIDRHGSPLIIHPLSQKKLEIRSIGLDKTPYTKDDIVR